MPSIVPDDGANYILSALKAYAPIATNGLYIALLTALPADNATMASGMNELVPTTGTYSRQNCPVGSLTISGDTLTCTGTFNFTGFTNSTPITHMALVTVGSGTSGRLVVAASLTQGNRTLASISDTLSIMSPTFRLS